MDELGGVTSLRHFCSSNTACSPLQGHEHLLHQKRPGQPVQPVACRLQAQMYAYGAWAISDAVPSI